jgi:hypothetical protein
MLSLAPIYKIAQTQKSQYDFNYILTKKGIKWAGAGAGLMLIAYNFRRIGNIMTMDRLREYLKIIISLFLRKKDLADLKRACSAYPCYGDRLLSLNLK